MIYSINLDIIFTLIQRINSITAIFFGIYHFPLPIYIIYLSRQNHIFNPICVRADACINARERRTSTSNSRWNNANQMIIENHGSPRISPTCIDSTALFARTHLCRIDVSALLHLFIWCLTIMIVPHLNNCLLKRISSITCSKISKCHFHSIWEQKERTQNINSNISFTNIKFLFNIAPSSYCYRCTFIRCISIQFTARNAHRPN